MVLTEIVSKGSALLACFGLTYSILTAAALAQNGGSMSEPPMRSQVYTPAPQTTASPARDFRYSAPVPGATGNLGSPQAQGLVPGVTARAYDRLPLNPGNAIARLEELRNLMPNSRPKDFQ